MNKYKNIEKDIIKHFKKGISVKAISKNFFIKQNTVYYLLKKHAIQIPKGLYIKKEQFKNIKKDHKKGFSLDILSIKYNIEKTRLCRILNAYELSDEKKQMVIILFQKGGYKPSHIAQRLSITTKAVKQVITDFGIEKRKNILKQVGLTKNEILTIRNKIAKKGIKTHD